ncbi:hypothetical protein [Azotobacter chroococcum]|uniref:hypothetical protein n=1 Tax=Azotobacter chroococcum TaxID=353 RepID=UPI0010AED095|nr:hypothetical protein [Azotobacter chroococcum]TKD45506.1 hypothetical protein FCG41_04060 [Azotobacter chroococcum]
MYGYAFKTYTTSEKPKSQITAHPTQRDSKYFYKNYFCNAIAHKKPLKIFNHNNGISRLPPTDQIAIIQNSTSANIKLTEKLEKPIQANAKAGKVIRNNPHKNFATHRNTIILKCHLIVFKCFFCRPGNSCALDLAPCRSPARRHIRNGNRQTDGTPVIAEDSNKFWKAAVYMSADYRKALSAQ